MAVVDVHEHVDRHGRLTGWAVVSWDGYVESSVFVGVHKGEPETPLDLDAQDEWCAWTGEREKAKRWAADVWGAVRRTDFRPEVGDVATTTAVSPGAVGDVKVVGVLVGDSNRPTWMVYDYGPHPLGVGTVVFWHAMKWDAETLARKRQKAVRELVPGDELWELVFAWPADEWESRWGMFIDGVREDRWGWGDGWVRAGDHLAAADWKPPINWEVT